MSLFSRQPPASYRWLPILIFIVGLLLALAALLTYRYMTSVITARTGQVLALAAADVADRLDQILFERHGDIQMMAKALRGRDVNAMAAYVRWMHEFYPYYRWIAVTDEKGAIIAATDPNRVGDAAGHAEWFVRSRDGSEVVINDVRAYAETEGLMALAFTAAIRDERGAFLGAVTSRVWLPVLEEAFIRTVQEAKRNGLVDLDYLFLRGDGEVIVDSLRREEGRVNLRDLGVPSAWLVSTAPYPGYVEERSPRRQVAIVTGYARTRGYASFPDPHWGVLIRIDRPAMLAPLYRVLWKLGIGGLLIMAPLFGLLVWTSHRLRVEWAGTREHERWLFTTLSSIGDAVIATDERARITFMNPMAERLTGWMMAAARGKALAEVFQIVDESTREPVESPVEKVLQEGVIVGLANRTLLVGRDGTARPIDDSGAPIRNDQGVIVGVVLVFRDVSERRAAEDRLRATEERLRVMVEGVTDYAIFMLDPHGRVASWNTGAQRITGYQAEEILGRPVSCFYLLEDQTAGTPDHQLAHATEHGRCEVEGWRVRKDGSRFWANTILTAVLDESGRLRGFAKVTRDITERREADRRILQSRDFYLKLFEDFPALIWRAGGDAKRDYFNRSWLDFTGRTFEQEQGDGWMDGMHPDDVTRFRDMFLAAFNDREPFEVIYRLRRADGDYRYIIDQGRPYCDLEGHFAGYIGFCSDITDQQVAVRRVRESEQQLTKAQALAHIGSWSWDVERNVVMWSDELYRIYGLPPGQPLSYDSFLRFVHPEDQSLVERAVATAVQQHEPFEFYHRIVRPDGVERILHGRGDVSLDSAGSVTGLYGTAQDVTELKRAEAALRQVRVELEERVQARTKELAQVNAELTDKIQDLEKFHDVVVGRELRMMELEEEVARLRAEERARPGA